MELVELTNFKSSYQQEVEQWRSPHPRVVLDTAGKSFRRGAAVTACLGTFIMIDTLFTQDVPGIAAGGVAYMCTSAGAVALYSASEFFFDLPAADDVA